MKEEESGKLRIKIGHTMINQNSENKPFTEYLIEMKLNGKNWKVTRKYKEFQSLD